MRIFSSSRCPWEVRMVAPWPATLEHLFLVRGRALMWWTIAQKWLGSWFNIIRWWSFWWLFFLSNNSELASSGRLIVMLGREPRCLQKITEELVWIRRTCAERFVYVFVFAIGVCAVLYGPRLKQMQNYRPQHGRVHAKKWSTWWVRWCPKIVPSLLKLQTDSELQVAGDTVERQCRASCDEARLLTCFESVSQWENEVDRVQN